MKNIFFLLLSFITIGITQAQTTQDTLYVWKAGQLVIKQSIKPIDMDSITFKRSVAAMSNVTIGTQVWATKNLDVTTYRDGTPIPEVKDATAWASLTTGAWCYYENSTANGTTYGKLYNWYAVAGIHDNEASTPNKVLAPTGWHVPTNAEWTTLTTFLGGESIAGSKMKATGTTLWRTSNTDVTNSSGFTGLPGGGRGGDGSLSGIGGVGQWWSSSEYTNTTAWFRNLTHYAGSADRNGSNKGSGKSVRCLRD